MTIDQEEKQKFIRALFIPFLLLFIVWSIKGIEILGGISFAQFGIYPLKIFGLLGILLSPLIHGDLNHLINNSVAIVPLTIAIFYFYRPIAFKVIILTWLVTGLCVWLGASKAYHIGASGLIYGEASFLLFSGLLRKNIKLIAISLLVIFLYGGMIWGIFPITPAISWESHLYGGLAGLAFAFIFSNEGPKKEEVNWDNEDDEEDPYWEQENFTDSEIESAGSVEKFEDKTQSNES